jgi:hypothetical protein
MPKAMRRWLAATSALAFSFVWAETSAAQEAETWLYQCLGDAVAGNKICTTELATFHKGEEFVVYFVHVDKGKPPLVISGESEDISRTTVAVDKNEPLVSQDCEDGACFFGAEGSATLMKQFRKGFRVKITIETTSNEVLFDRVLSLRGFTAALTAPPG